MVSRNWCFTLNNPEEFDAEAYPQDSEGPLEPLLQGIPKLRYCCYQLELSESGTLHYQGYAEFSATVRFSVFRSAGELAFGHYEIRRGTREQARDYCRKDDTTLAGPWEYGQWTGGQGTRTDLEDAAQSLLQNRSLRDVAISHPASFIKFHGGFAKLLEITAPLPPQPEPEWRPWQVEALALISGTPDPRKVHWFVDYNGGTGKSFLVRYLATNRSSLPLSSGRHDRLLNAFQGQSIVTFDFARDVNSGNADHDRTPYSVIESIKNGVVFSGFFGAPPRVFGLPHVLCFSNFEPDLTKLSADRWDVRYL